MELEKQKVTKKAKDLKAFLEKMVGGRWKVRVFKTGNSGYHFHLAYGSLYVSGGKSVSSFFPIKNYNTKTRSQIVVAIHKIMRDQRMFIYEWMELYRTQKGIRDWKELNPNFKLGLKNYDSYKR